MKGREVEIEESFQTEGGVSIAACSSYLASRQTITLHRYIRLQEGELLNEHTMELCSILAVTSDG